MSDKSPSKKKARSDDACTDEASTSKTSGVHLTDAEARVVKIQFEKEYDIPKAVKFDDLLVEYCRFMEIKLSEKNATEPYAPSYLLDMFWHAHILSTREYFAFCERHNGGEYVHHDPTMKRGQERYEAAIEAYKELFGNRPSDFNIWPDHVDNVPQSDGDDDDDDEDDSSEEEYDADGNIGKTAYLYEHGDERGRTEEELVEWHRQAILDPANNEGFDPRKHPDVSNCMYGHRWYDYKFDLDCPGCRQSSHDIGGFSCG